MEVIYSATLSWFFFAQNLVLHELSGGFADVVIREGPEYTGRVFIVMISIRSSNDSLRSVSALSQTASELTFKSDFKRSWR